ncbi:hypothetical protein DH2020_041186 [Rehmannia glutinosa]|uniref:ribonuclease Z n=1 Tax=Rehmannia glutinosa TaxID=99300 RepID=A0ABR0USZ9_REHGL
MDERDESAKGANTWDWYGYARHITISTAVFDKQRFIFNAGEVNVWGPSDLKYLVDAMKSFIPNAAMVHTRSFGPAPDSNGSSSSISRKFDDPFVLINDEVVKISAVLLRPSHVEVFEPTKEKTFESSSPQSGGNATKPGDLSVIYICELPEIKGKFDPKKAAALGLRPGPKFRELQLGKSVESDRQNVMVHPSDVMGPSVPGPIVLLVDCPTFSHFQELLSLQCLAPYYIDTEYDVSECSKIVNCVIHLTPAFITQTDDYQIWMLKFGAAQHIMAGHEMLFILRPYANLGLDKSSVPSLSSPSEIIEELLSEIPEVKDASEQVTQIWLDNKGSTKEKTSIEATNVMTEEPWLDESALPSCLENITREEVEIVLLGTGSSQPSKYRNVSSIFINLFSKGSLLLDCGEGTLGQLKRRHDLLKGSPHEPIIVVGPRQLKRFLDAYQRLEDLDMQFLDCWHTTEASLEALDSNEENPTNFHNPKNGNADSTLFAKGSRMQSYWKRPGSPTQVPILKSLKNVLMEAGLEALISFRSFIAHKRLVLFCKPQIGLTESGKLYQGGKSCTRVTPGLVRTCQSFSRGNVLIHEATFEDSMVDEAIARNHSTTKEAVEVGDSAGAYRIILTHFSQRYPKIPVFDESHTHNTCIAFDLMSVNLADVHVLPKVLPHLKLLFRDEMIVDESEDVNLVTAAA